MQLSTVESIHTAVNEPLADWHSFRYAKLAKKFCSIVPSSMNSLDRRSLYIPPTTMEKGSTSCSTPFGATGT